MLALSKSKLEKKWWFELPCAIAAYLAAILLLHEAGLRHPFESLAGSFALLLCWFGFERVISVIAWFVVLLISPKHATGS